MRVKGQTGELILSSSKQRREIRLTLNTQTLSCEALMDLELNPLSHVSVQWIVLCEHAYQLHYR